MPETRTEEVEQTRGHSFTEELRTQPHSGENAGTGGPHAEKASRTAYDIKDAHDSFNRLPDDQLKLIPILPEGAQLEQGATYFDARRPEQGEFRARADTFAGSDNWYVPKSEVPYQLWNTITGVENPERRGQANEGSTR
jgi:hypothetical protein